MALGRLAEAVEVAEKSISQNAELWTQRWLWSKFYRDIDPDRTLALLEELAERSKSEIPRKLLKEILNEIAYWRLEMKKRSASESSQTDTAQA